ncbi:GNAT family N-acetyltransferase [Tamlana crocina]|uniref:GNAT family N-acetyltransferase n=1 Tax=Tamlana crocina TaxID=393006 RepID=A0ABX1D6N3_9FLAO|nr:GNAT family N-acetyltransferase [Tamlana crocina]NJX13991.1 GNAT family N-acetyltransferase [Tamlana crocina]
MLTTIVKSFEELTKQELYKLLQLRNQVFVLEQHCIYLDLDGKDQKALHVLGYKNKELIAYTRIFKPGDYLEEASIGRVLVVKNERKHHYGNQIMEASIMAIKEYFETQVIQISAQCYLRKFYGDLGFSEFGEEYLEDDIPHIGMIGSF